MNVDTETGNSDKLGGSRERGGGGTSRKPSVDWGSLTNESNKLGSARVNAAENSTD